MRKLISSFIGRICLFVKRISQKIASQKGDSFAEAMIALLIAAMGTAALATMIMTSTSIISTNENAMKKVYANENEIAKTVPSTTSETGLVTVSGEGLDADVEVKVYSSDNFSRYEVQ